MSMKDKLGPILLATAIGLTTASASAAADDKKKPDFPEFKKISEGYTKVVSTTSGKTFYNVWKRDKDSQLLAELPRGYESQKHFFAMTVATGEIFAGLQGGDDYVYWKRYDKRIALMRPMIDVVSTGDNESKDSVKQIFTDHVILDVPIVAIGPSGQPVIDLDGLLVGKAGTFFGYQARGLNSRLVKIREAKAFPNNIEIEFEAPVSNGTLKAFHYSISLAKGTPGYKPRIADDRLGYFNIASRDLGKMKDSDVWVRYINRWNLQKADPKLKLSPPKQPIIYYVDHTVPVRYRRWVRQGVLYWNQAFEKIGIKDAIEVYYQDKTTGAHMDKDPEDVRYNFLRWLSNDIGTAIGPSRVMPTTGEILDADIVLTDGWIRHFWYQANEYLPRVAMEGMTPETIDWLAKNPDWDPRVRLAEPDQRDEVIAQIAKDSMYMLTDGTDEHSCIASMGKSMDMALMNLHMTSLGLLDDKKGDSEEEDDEQMLDDIPEWFVGPMLADLVAHELGHTLGLRHNFRASSIYSLAEMNSEEFKGNKTITGSVMDYTPVNINMDDDQVQGDYAMVGLGPYDYWVIEYGYTLGDPKKVLERVNDPELTYATDPDTVGPDPFARRYDFTSDPLEYAMNRIQIAEYHRKRILTDYVKDGESWSRARRGYRITLGAQSSGMSMMANWIGGAYVSRAHKGDPDSTTPITPVEAKKQRDALSFIIDHVFYDEAYGLTPELLSHMPSDNWSGGYLGTASGRTYQIHDSIMGLQATAMTLLMNPTTLRRVYDNEMLTPSDEDMFTLPELLSTLTKATWSELDNGLKGKYSVREPAISSLRRNLQREHLDRLLSLAQGYVWRGASSAPLTNLAMLEVHEIQEQIEKALKSTTIDRYSKAHLAEASDRIQGVMEANYIRTR